VGQSIENKENGHPNDEITTRITPLPSNQPELSSIWRDDVINLLSKIAMTLEKQNTLHEKISLQLDKNSVDPEWVKEVS